MNSDAERAKQEVVSEPKISEVLKMATTVEKGVRQDMVATAVRFLENDRVRASTDDMKRQFLLKKGLNEGEIREAFARVKPAVQQPAPQQAVSLQVGGAHPVIAVSQSSFSSRIRDLLNLLLLIGGASYGLRYLWKTYIAPWLFGPAKPVPNPQAAVVETCQAVLGGVHQLQQAITSLQTSISSQAEKLERAVESGQSSLKGRQENTGQLGELKAEIQSVKGLLLSSRSLPQQPPVSAPPSLPAWQLKQNDTKAPDLLAAASTDGQRSAEASSANASSATSSANASSASEIEMLSPDSGQELSGEEGQ